MHTITLPNIIEVLDTLQSIHTKMDGTTKTIHDWIIEQRERIAQNRILIDSETEQDKVRVFKGLVVELLMRAVRGERGKPLRDSLEQIDDFSDLNESNLRYFLTKGQYRWGVEDGLTTIQKVLEKIESIYKWNWRSYFDKVDTEYISNFQSDPFLKIKNIKFKVRDLALSNFNDRYLAGDLHVVRVATRLGLLNYGFHLLQDEQYEMGNNASNPKNYLFLHALFQQLSAMTSNKYSPVDIDRSFWHFGRTICTSKPKCAICPLNKICLTGQARTLN